MFYEVSFSTVGSGNHSALNGCLTEVLSYPAAVQWGPTVSRVYGQKTECLELRTTEVLAVIAPLCKFDFKIE